MDGMSKEGKMLLSGVRASGISSIESLRKSLEREIKNYTLIEKMVLALEENIDDEAREEMRTIVEEMEKMEKMADEAEARILGRFGRKELLTPSEKISENCKAAAKRHGITISVPVIKRKSIDTQIEKDILESLKAKKENSNCITEDEMSPEDIEALEKLREE